MPRPPKFPDHAIARVRKELNLTREQLAKRTGISVHSLREIERQTYRLQPDTAKKISLATGVAVSSLLRNDEILLDGLGQPFTAASVGKKAHRDFRTSRNSAEQLFSILLAEISESERGQEVFYLEFNIWIAEIATRLGLKRKMLDRIFRLAQDEGVSFLVPEGLLLGDARERRRWRDEHFKVLVSIDDDGELRESAMTKRMKEMGAVEEHEFNSAHPGKATQLRELEERGRLGNISASQKKQLGRLRWFRIRLGFRELEQAKAWRAAADHCMKFGLPTPPLRPSN